MTFRNTKSANATNIPRINTVTITTSVESISSFRVGHDDFFNSAVTSTRKSRTLRNGFVMCCYFLPPPRHRDPTNLPSRDASPISSRLARQEGLEPPTYGFGDRRSAN